MTKATAFVAMLAVMVLYVTMGRLAAEERESDCRVNKETKAVLLKLHKDQEVPRSAIPGMAVDIVGEISQPIKTGIALVNVKLLGYDAKCDGKEQAVTVQLTLAQMEVLALMQKHGTKLGMKLREKE
jgi:hypothetical protein